MKVKDVMRTNVRYVSPEMPAKNALYKLLNEHISGLPVIGENKCLSGMFTEKDVLRYIMPTYVEQVGKFTYTETPKSIIHKLSAIGDIKVKELMRKEVVTISPEASLGEAAHVALTQKARRMPVIENGKVVGIVSREDVLREFARESGLLKRENE